MDETFSYDGNGNIKTTLRHGGFSAPRDMDDLTYNYNKDGNGHLTNNKLRHINDNITFYPDNNTHDLSNQVTDNYHYDAIGNLIADQETGISNVDWSVYGKIKAITKASGNGPSLAYTYDPAWQRATKLVNGVTTWYIRDASGNTMAVYDNKGGTTNWREQDLYGSSRLGLWTPNVNLANNNASTVWDTIGHKLYELANHLGNVLATITDKRIPHSSDGTTIDYYNPETATAQDYYAFGFQVPKRGYTLDKPYRYGFNGKENDNDVKVDFDGNEIPGAQQDYGMRIYDPRVGRFLSVDPLQKSFAYYSPYQFAGNTPIQATDLDGRETFHYTLSYNYSGKPILSYDGVQTREISDWQTFREIFSWGFKKFDWKEYNGPLLKDVTLFPTIDVSTPNGTISFKYFRELLAWQKNGYQRQVTNEEVSDITTLLYVHANNVVDESMGHPEDDIPVAILRENESVSSAHSGNAEAQKPNLEANSKVQSVNGRKPINSSYAGTTFEFEPNSALAKKYPNGVKFDEKGFPDFTPYARKIVDIGKLNGSSGADVLQANRMAGFGDVVPENFTWHHIEHSTKLELVPSDIHEAVRHTGGRATNAPRK